MRHVETWPLARAVGGELEARVEQSQREDRIDHVWITMSCATVERVLVSINTRSLRNLEAGEDPRVRIGRLAGSSETLPPRGWSQAEPFDYTTFEAEHTVFYEALERPAIEAMLLEWTGGAVLLEAWGAPYRRGGRPGLHQIHSRRASCAVNEDVRGHDGGIRFYFQDGGGFSWLLVLAKFCGQP